MNRRELLKYIALTTILSPTQAWADIPFIRARTHEKYPAPPFVSEEVRSFSEQNASVSSEPASLGDNDIKDYLSKVRHPNTPHAEDIILETEQRAMLRSIVARFNRIRAHVGHGNFGVLGFEDACRVARYGQGIDPFTDQERVFLEDIFWRDATEYGFYGEKQTFDIAENIVKEHLYKVPYSGNYLFRGEPVAKYEKIKKDIGENLILTSGVRGLAKQFYLFLAKADRYDGNLSLASRSLAPPGYSYHGVGDFDVGQRGLGGANFSEEFLETEIYAELIERGYVQYRYGKDNPFGVRYEPWHIKV